MKIVFILLLAFCAFAFAQSSSGNSSNGLGDISGIYADDKDQWSFHIRHVNDMVWMVADPASSGNSTGGSSGNSTSDKRFVFFGHVSGGSINLNDMSGGNSSSGNSSDIRALIVGNWAFVPMSEGQNLSASDWGLLVLALDNNGELRIVSDTNFKDAFPDVTVIRKAGGSSSSGSSSSSGGM